MVVGKSLRRWRRGEAKEEEEEEEALERNTGFDQPLKRAARYRAQSLHGIIEVGRGSCRCGLQVPNPDRGRWRL